MTNEEAIKILQNDGCCQDCTFGGYPCKLVGCETHQAIDLAIAALEERPQGEWKYHKGDELFLPYMECSNCKVQDSLGKLTKKEYREVNHFCFNCGAKMKGGKEE